MAAPTLPDQDERVDVEPGLPAEPDEPEPDVPPDSEPVALDAVPGPVGRDALAPEPLKPDPLTEPPLLDPLEGEPDELDWPDERPIDSPTRSLDWLLDPDGELDRPDALAEPTPWSADRPMPWARLLPAEPVEPVVAPDEPRDPWEPEMSLPWRPLD